LLFIRSSAVAKPINKPFKNPFPPMHRFMKKPAILILAIITSFAFIFATTKHEASSKAEVTTAPAVNESATNSESSAEAEAEALYTELNLQAVGMKQTVFSTALQGFKKLVSKGAVPNDRLITIADFSQPSNQKRLYIVDLKSKKILFNTLVAHGKNTGALMAKNFSNSASSLQSSPGFYVTEDTYTGHNGYSLRINGLEKNINDNALARAVVMHGAPYVDQSFANAMGYLGRSWGCPAVPVAQHKAIINTIKGGTCLFIYTTENNYLGRSTVLNS
jgi:hypothetical protein